MTTGKVLLGEGRVPLSLNDWVSSVHQVTNNITTICKDWASNMIVVVKDTGLLLTVFSRFIVNGHR